MRRLNHISAMHFWTFAMHSSPPWQSGLFGLGHIPVGAVGNVGSLKSPSTTSGALMKQVSQVPAGSPGVATYWVMAALGWHFATPASATAVQLAVPQR